MAPPKRSRPAFSPPRPKPKSSTRTSISKSKSTSKRTSTVRKRRQREDDDQNDSQISDDQQGPSVLDLVDMQADSDDDASEPQEPTEEEEENSNLPSSPSEPDAVLVEVTDSSGTAGKPPIPIPLIHRMLAHHFSTPDKTKISKDAREVVAKYVEVFVREAIMRCALERGKGTVGDDGWLEVGDLERTAVQLCLDF